MRSLKLLVVLPLLLGWGMLAVPALAGGWALTVLDPVPGQLEADRTYTIGYWVLQHGTHAYDGELDTALRIERPGRTVRAAGVPLPEPGHFAAAIATPEDGTWTVVAEQGWFGDHRVGTLTVPGALKVDPVDDASTHAHGGAEHEWGAIRPPGFETPSPDGHAHAAGSASSDVSRAASEKSDSAGLPWLRLALVGSGLLVLPVAVALVLRRRRSARPR